MSSQIRQGRSTRPPASHGGAILHQRGSGNIIFDDYQISALLWPQGGYHEM